MTFLLAWLGQFDQVAVGNTIFALVFVMVWLIADRRLPKARD